MLRIARAVALACLVATGLGISGCANPWPLRPSLTTWTGTYAEFPESVYNTPHDHGQGDPGDG